MRILSLLALLALATPSSGQRADRATPGWVRVRLETSVGNIVLALDQKHAPISATNFLRYVDDGRFDGIAFYRAARAKSRPTTGFIQSGIRTDARRFLDTIAHEPTSKTGITHTDGTISMARRDPGTANGNWFITVGAAPGMDARGDYPGYAAFGHVVAGMDVVKRILALRTGGAMGGTLILKPIRVTRAVRLDGVAKPTGRPRPWLIELRRDG